MIYQQTKRGETVAVITLFAASPFPDHLLSRYAQSLHQRWQMSGPHEGDFSDPPAVRREEDRRALATLGRDIQVVHCDLLDCIYRVDADGEAIYTSDEAIFGAVHPGDPALSDLHSVPTLPGGSMLYLPLSIGNHVDHQIVRSAAENWGIDQQQVYYYEDYPYITYPGALEAALGNLDLWCATTYPLSEEAITVKIRTVAEHASQLSTFWDSQEAMGAALREHVQENNGERLWRKIAG